MDDSKPKQGAPPVKQSLKSLCSISGWLALYSGAPVAWGCIHHKTTAQSSCEADVHSIKEATKLVLHLKLLFCDLDMPIQSSIPLHNDNQGTVQWSKCMATKKMKWIDLHENFVRKNVVPKAIFISHIPGLNNLFEIFLRKNSVMFPVFSPSGIPSWRIPHVFDRRVPLTHVPGSSAGFLFFSINSGRTYVA